jgi:xanthine dehydrogenase small subunit
LYPSEQICKEFQERRGQPLEVQAEWDGQSHEFFSPPDLPSALSILADHPDAVIVAGATDVGVRINKSLAVPRKILDLNRVDELVSARVEDGELILGARASWTTVEEICRTYAPELQKIAAIFGAPQIRHVGTIGGNIANASPIADSLPFLHVMEAQLTLRSAVGSRELNINEFFKGYKKFDLRRGEMITEVRVPLLGDDELLRLYKVSRRRDLDISSFTAAIRMTLDGEIIENASIAFGAVGPIVIRARETEAFLQGRQFNEGTMREAGDVAIAESTPISDVRGAADYRYQLTRNVLLKFFHDFQSAAVTV